MSKPTSKSLLVGFALIACGGSTDSGLNGGTTTGGTAGAASGGVAGNAAGGAGGVVTGGAGGVVTGGAGGVTGGAGGVVTGGTGGVVTGGTGGVVTGGAGGVVTGGTGGVVTGGTGGTGGVVTGGAGGTGGGPTVTCTDLEIAYAKALAKAKACNPMLSVIQCDKLVDTKLACPCSTFVNHNNQAAIQELASLSQQWNQMGCGKNVICPDIACLQPSGAACVPGGSGGPGVCKDLGSL